MAYNHIVVTVMMIIRNIVNRKDYKVWVQFRVYSLERSQPSHRYGSTSFRNRRVLAFAGSPCFKSLRLVAFITTIARLQSTLAQLMACAIAGAGRFRSLSVGFMACEVYRILWFRDLSFKFCTSWLDPFSSTRTSEPIFK